MNREYDLEERLLDYSSDIIEIVESLKPAYELRKKNTAREERENYKSEPSET
jgi:hypothetical protein